MIVNIKASRLDNIGQRDLHFISFSAVFGQPGRCFLFLGGLEDGEEFLFELANLDFELFDAVLVFAFFFGAGVDPPGVETPEFGLNVADGTEDELEDEEVGEDN